MGTWQPCPTDYSSIDNECVFSPTQLKENSLVEYNRIEYKQLVIAPELDYLEEWGDPWPHIYWQGVFDECTFGRTNFFSTFNSCGGVVEWDCPEVRCYDDSKLSLNFVNGEACNPTSVYIEGSVLSDNTLFYPNPVRIGEFVEVNNYESIRGISVFAINRNQIKSDFNHRALQIDLPLGYYIISSQLKNGQKICSKLIVLP